MSKVDDELTRRLRRAERPVDDNAVFEGLARRRSHRERVRRVQGGLLAFAVLAATTAGFVALRRAFDPDELATGVSPSPGVLPANGEIVFSRGLPDGSEHLFAVRPGVAGERLITSGGTAVYRDASVAPDGRSVAVVHWIPSFGDDATTGVIATVPIESGPPTWLTRPIRRVADPSWSPDGSLIAFAGVTGGQGLPAIYVMNADGSDIRSIAALDGLTLSEPDWSPDGRRLVFVGLAAATSEAEQTNPDLYTVGIDGSGLANLTETPTFSEWSPSWSPEGDVIAYHRNEGNISNSIQLIDSTGRPAGTVFDDPDVGEIGGLDWSPDGRRIAFTSSLALTDTDDEGDLDVWTVRVNGSDLRNLTTEGASGISWQPLPAGSGPVPSPTSEPTVSASPEPAGRDIGLGFRLCHVQRMGGIDWYGDGTSGAAWTGARLTDQGQCPSDLDGEYVVAADLDGDGRAEPGGMGFLDQCLLCRPFAATDLSGDGVLELVVLEEASSTPSYSLYEVSVPTSERSPGIYALFVAPPGYPAGGFPGDEAIRFLAGGDEGYSAAIDCEGYPEAPVLVVAWSNYVVEVDDTEDVYVTRLRLGEDGVFHVVESEHFTQDVGDPLPIDPAGKACGVDFDPF